MYQALSHLTVLQATGSWARAWNEATKCSKVLKTAASKRQFCNGVSNTKAVSEEKGLQEMTMQ